MATKIDPRSQPRGPADGTGEVTLVLLREQFQRSFVPRMSEDDTETPRVSPQITPRCITGQGTPSITEARISPSIHDASVTPKIVKTTPKVVGRMTPSVTEARVGAKKVTGSRFSRTAFRVD